MTKTKAKTNLLCRIFGHSWRLKERCHNRRLSMKCRVCGRVMLVKRVEP